MTTLDTIINQTKQNERAIKDIFKLINDWKRENYENCIRYCTHRSVMTTDPKTGERTCSLCGRV